MTAVYTEPAVLAVAKDALYPTPEDSGVRYAVTETQFTKSNWGGWSIPAEIRERLSPFNTIRLTNGEPDLLGVGMPALDVLNGDAANTPVAVIEAKGHNEDPNAADVSRGIEQAHRHLSEVNIGYVAAPLQSISETERALARNLDVGIIGVTTAGEGVLIEPPRVTGAGDFSTAIDAFRFQAVTHHLTEGSFPVNHPKNYLGYVLALAASDDTEDVYTEYVIKGPQLGRHGAILLQLVDDQPHEDQLTHLGAEVVRFARSQHGCVLGALEQFDEWTGRSTRFTQLAPQWAQFARSITIQYKPTQLIVDALERLHSQGVGKATIDEVARQACRINQPLAVELFFSQHRRDEILNPEGDLNGESLTDPSVYKTGIHFQFKFQLYHVGILTSGGTDSKGEVLTNEWALEQPFHS